MHLTTPHRPAAVRRRRGFTLIELVVVVIIIAVLAATAGLAYNRYVSQARQTAATATLKQLWTATAAKAAADDLDTVTLPTLQAAAGTLSGGATALGPIEAGSAPLAAGSGVVVVADGDTPPAGAGRVIYAKINAVTGTVGLATSAGADKCAALYGTGLNAGAPKVINADPANGCTGTTAVNEATGSLPQAPDAPTGVIAAAGDTQAVVSFTAPVFTGNAPLTGYRVTCTPGAGAPVVVNGFTSPVTVTGLVNGTTYSCTVAAKNSFGTSSETAAATVKPVKPTTVPGVPTAVTATAGDGKVTVAFTAPASDGGDPITSYRATCTPATGTQVTQTGASSPLTVTGLAGGTAYTCTVAAKNTVGWSTESTSASATPTKALNTVTGWGSNSYGQLGVASPAIAYAPVTGFPNAAAIVGGQNHTCAIMTGGTVACVGDNSYGQLGNGNSSGSTSTPVTVTGLSNVTELTAGVYHTCALKADGTVACWGYNYYGQLGNVTNYGGTNPAPVAVTGLSGVTALTAGMYHTCALKSDGTVACWGYNNNGQTGNSASYGNYDYQARPVTGLTGATAIAAGRYHTCALKTGGTAACWGYSNYGQLGDNGATSTSVTPVSVSGLTGATAITAGRYHTCALTGGTIKCWGNNGSGQLGDPYTQGSSANTPTVVPGLSGITAISAGYLHTCALKSTGAVTCFGNGSSGQLGDGYGSTTYSPSTVTGLTGYTALSTGSMANHTFALKP